MGEGAVVLAAYWTLTDWLSRYRVADVTGVVGFIVTIFGFGVTIVSIWRARAVAEAARDAAEKARADLLSFQGSVSLAHVLARMEDLKTLHRHGVWHALPDRYSTLRRDLGAVMARHGLLTERQTESLRRGIILLSRLERDADRRGQEPMDTHAVADANEWISGQLDELERLLYELERSQSEGEHHV